MCARIYLEYLAGNHPDWDVVEDHHLSKEGKSSLYNLEGFEKKKIGGDVLVKDLSKACPKNNPFYDHKIVITGEFSLSRKEIAQILKDYGADVNTSISKLTNYVLVGSAPGTSKVAKIKQLKEQGYEIRILNEEDFFRIINGIGTDNLAEYMIK